jgi:WD40 repeat protein
MSLPNPTSFNNDQARGPRMPRQDQYSTSPGFLSLGGSGIGTRFGWGWHSLLRHAGRNLLGLMLAAFAPFALGGTVPSVSGPTDLFGDPLPHGAITRFGTVRLRHSKPVRAVAVSPEGKVLASLDNRGQLFTWECASGRLLQRLLVPAAPFGVRPQMLAFSPSGDRLAVAGENCIALYEPHSGQQQRSLSHPGEVEALHFSPDGRTLVAGCSDGSIHLWELATGKKTRVFGMPGKRVSCVAFSPDGKTLVSNGANFTLEYWDTVTGERLHTLEIESLKKQVARPGQGVVCAAFSRDGKAVAVGVSGDRGEGGTYLLDAANGKELRRFDDWATDLHCLALSPDGSLLSTAGFRADSVRVWEVSSGRRVLHSPDYLPTAVCFSPDGRNLVTGGWDGTIRLWDLRSGKERERPGEHLQGIRSITFAPNGRIAATTSADRTVRLWDAATGRPLALVREDRTDSPPLSPHVCFLPDARTFLFQRDPKALSVYDLASGREVRTFTVLENLVQTFTASPDGKILAVRTIDGNFKERRIHLIEAATGQASHRLRDPAISTRRVGGLLLGIGGPLRFSPDGKVLASASYSTVRQWETASGKELCRLEGHQAQVNRVTFFPGGQLLGTKGGEYESHGHPIDHTNRLWEDATGRQLWLAQAEESPFWDEFSPDGRTFAAVATDAILVCETASGKTLLRFASPDSGLPSLVSFSPETQRLASGYSDGTALIWDLTPKSWQPPTGKATAEKLSHCWTDLTGEDAPRAHRAIYILAKHGTPALAFLRDRLKPVPKDYAERLRKRIAALDSDDFRTRETAMRELTRLGPDAVLPLHAALDAKPSVEARKRIEALLKELHPWYIKDPETLRTVRAIWALQLMATPEARAVLDTLAAGAPEARITQEAQAALRFLDRNRKP